MSISPAMDLAPSYDHAQPANDAPATMPCNLEAEQALLGILLYDNAAFDRCDDLDPKWFYEPFHARLFEAVVDAVRVGKIAEPILLADRFAGDRAFHELDGLRYLADLVDRAPPAANAGDYAAAIEDAGRRREIMRIADEARRDALGQGEKHITALELTERTEQALFALAEGKNDKGGFVAFGDALDLAVDIAIEAYQRDGGMSGIATDLIDLDQKIGGLHPSDLIVLAGRPSMGKAQPLSAKVLLRDGSWRRMGDLRLGDELASVDGVLSRVAGIFPQGERQTYRVTFSDGRSAVTCGEHLWQVNSCKFDGPKVVSTDEISKMLKLERFQRRLTVPVVSGHFGQAHDLPVDPWLLGALLGNGCMSGDHLSISTAESATLYRVQKAVGHDMVRPSGGSGYDYAISRGPDLGLKSALVGLGLYGKRSEEKFIPPVYLSAGREARLELLRGLLDTDGWVESFGAVRYGTSSERLALDVQALVRSLGGACTIATKIPTFTSKGEKKVGLRTYTCNIQHPDKASLLTLKRKRRRCDRPYRYRAPSIVSVTPEAVEPVQCIRVTHPTALYVTDDYVVTHNTALATNIAFNIAKRYAFEVQPDGAKKTTAGGIVGFYSLEMSKEQLALRIIADVTGISGDRIRKGEVDQSEIGRIRDARNELRQVPLHIDATGGISIAKLCARARRLKRTKGLDLLIVDYLQLVTSTMTQAQRVQQITEITMALKALAKELDIPVIALSQLSRQVEQRDDKRPQLSDLRESGSIEQDADMVWFVFREAYYVGRAEPREGTPEHMTWQEEMDKLRNLAELIIAKQRHGPIGTVRLSFNSDTTRFGNLAKDHYFAQARDRGPSKGSPRSATLPYRDDE